MSNRSVCHVWSECMAAVTKRARTHTHNNMSVPVLSAAWESVSMGIQEEASTCTNRSIVVKFVNLVVWPCVDTCESLFPLRYPVCDWMTNHNTGYNTFAALCVMLFLNKVHLLLQLSSQQWRLVSIMWYSSLWTKPILSNVGYYCERASTTLKILLVVWRLSIPWCFGAVESVLAFHLAPLWTNYACRFRSICDPEELVRTLCIQLSLEPIIYKYVCPGLCTIQ